MIEIERKFLVISSEYKALAHQKSKISQGYLSKDPNRTVRVRIRKNQGFLTIKGLSSEDGMSRFEWEKEIPVQEAEQLMSLCLPTVIQKTRYEIYFKGYLFEIDEFEGIHKGLVLGEVELKNTEELVDLPSWIGREVTGDKQFYNSFLSNSK